jgi:hypothetical protein
MRHRPRADHRRPPQREVGVALRDRAAPPTPFRALTPEIDLGGRALGCPGEVAVADVPEAELATLAARSGGTERHTLVAVDHQLRDSTPKSDHGRRSVALDAGTVRVLREWRKHQLEERLAWGPAWTDNGRAFAREDGTDLHPERVSERFDRLVKESGLPRLTVHGLRHTHATLALQAGIHPKVVQERLSHSSVAFTLDKYSHAIPAMQEDAAETVARLVGLSE